MEKQKRRSLKRNAILQTIRATSEHPSAEWVYARLKPEYPNLSLGTVYRNIAEFVKTGEIVCVAAVNGTERYDGDTGSHAHFICSRCGGITDVALSVDAELVEAAEQASGAKVDDVRLSFCGVCGDCASGALS